MHNTVKLYSSQPYAISQWLQQGHHTHYAKMQFIKEKYGENAKLTDEYFCRLFV